MTENRLKHMESVAKFMYDNAEKFSLDSNQMYLLGLLHDIGYIEKGFGSHDMVGYALLSSVGYKGARFVECHSMTPDEVCREWRIKRCDLPDELVLLWYADMYVDSEGNVVGFDNRLKDIKNVMEKQVSSISLVAKR